MGRFVASWLVVAAWSACAWAGDAYEITTPGVPGTDGVVPALAGEGSAVPGSANTLLLSDALPHAPALLVFSVSELAAPFAGGVLGPAPDFVASLGIADADGALGRRFRVPESAPVGLELWMQAWVRDAGGAAGFAASNTLRVTVPPALPAELAYPAALFRVAADVTDLDVGDVDLDGRDDVVIASASGDAIGLHLLLNGGDGRFLSSLTPLAGTATSAVALGDLNGDGALDIVTAHTSSASVSVLLGDGRGGFAGASQVAWSAFPTRLRLHDLDADGVLDLLVSKVGSSALSFRLGRGDGTFAPEQAQSAGGAPLAITAADVDADGLPDLVAVVTPPVFPFARQLSVSLAQEGGGYAAAQFMSADGAEDVVVLDLDGDGLVDLVTVNPSDGDLSLLRGLGGGTFAAAQSFLAGAGPLDLLCSDLDGDGLDDLAVANLDSNDISVFLVEPGSSTLPAPAEHPTGSGPARVFALELQGDDCVDLLALDTLGFFTPFKLAALPGTGGGDFLSPVRHAANPSVLDVALGDIDGDQRLDVVVTNYGVDRVSVLLGDGDGGFGLKQGYVVADQPQAVTTGDVDGDGDDDVLVSTIDVPLQVLLAAGDGTLGVATSIGPVDGVVEEFALRDVNADGHLDVIALMTSESALCVFLGLGDGSFEPIDPVTLPSGVTDLALGDFDTNGTLDVALQSSGVSVRVLLGAGDGSFGAPATYPLGGSEAQAADLSVGDMNGDGVPDLVSGLSMETSVVAVSLGVGDGSFVTPPQLSPLAPDTFLLLREFHLTDVDGDADLDLIGVGNDLHVMLGDGGGALAPALRYGAGGGPIAVSVGDLDADGRPDAVVTVFKPNGVAVLLNQLDP